MRGKEIIIEKDLYAYAVQTGIKEAINFRKNNRNKREKDIKIKQRTEKNTLLLMENYQKIKKVVEEIKEFKSQPLTTEEIIQELLEETFNNRTFEKFIYSDEKTLLIFSHIEKMLLIFKQICVLNGRETNFNIMHDFYIREDILSYEVICEKYSLHQSSIYRRRNKALKEFSYLLFGISHKYH